MKKYTIISGQFSEAGNFTGKASDGKSVENVHVYKQQLEVLGITKSNIKFPLFCSADSRTFNVRDPKTGELTDETFSRLTANVIWKDRKEMVTVLAQADERLIDAAVNAEVKKIAAADGLTLADLGLEELVNASVVG